VDAPHLNDVTLCLSYYENPMMLRHQLEYLAAIPDEVKSHIRLIVVDDGSPDHPAEPVIAAAPSPGCPLALYRMDVDIRWNQDACRNLAASQAETRWLLLTDMDHVVPLKTWVRIIMGRLTWKEVYTFSRKTGAKLSMRNPHPNTWLLTVDRFDAAGGYDESLAGWYGTDGDFKRRLARVATIVLVPEFIHEVTPDMVPDCRTTRYDRKTPEDRTNLSRLIAKRGAAAPVKGRFPWHRVS